MKRYEFVIIIEEGSDEFWESIVGAGVNEVAECLVSGLSASGFTDGVDCKLQLRHFTDDSDL